MQQASEYLLTTEVCLSDGKLNEGAEIWNKYLDDASQLYFSESSNSLLELRSISVGQLAELPKSLNDRHHKRLKKSLSPLMQSDFRQELLCFKEGVIDQKAYLPQGDYLQMRHIEVPLNVHENYLEWRERTIFSYVRELANIESFTAYHSCFSTLPGVMFVSSFSCDPKIYAANFSTDAYQEIVRQAGDKYISGGKEGLYTKIYKRYIGKTNV
jgi:hypothetical protein